jgi:hypothetical protein
MTGRFEFDLDTSEIRVKQYNESDLNELKQARAYQQQK